MKIELTEDEAKALLEIIPASISHAKQAMYYYEQLNEFTESDQANYDYYCKLFADLSAIRDKLSVEPAPVSES